VRTDVPPFQGGAPRRVVQSRRLWGASLGQHAFDLFHSIRFEAVVEGIEAFAAWVRSERVKSRGGGEEISRGDPVAPALPEWRS